MALERKRIEGLLKKDNIVLMAGFYVFGLEWFVDIVDLIYPYSLATYNTFLRGSRG
ncbi:MAG: hypothetical protein ACK5ND_08735 [Bacteroides sp.]